jgi:diguanylate cyclase
MNPPHMDGPASQQSDQTLETIDAGLGRGDIDTARQLAETVLRDGGLSADPLAEAKTVLRLAYCDLAQSRVQRAHGGARRVARTFRDLAAQSEEVDALALISRAASDLGRSVEAVETALLATQLCEDLPAGLCTARAHVSLGRAYGWARSFAKAERAFETARQVVDRHGNAAAQLEVCAARHWVRVFRWAAERRGQERELNFEGLQQLLGLQQAGPAPYATKLTPGAGVSLGASTALLCGFMSLCSGDVNDARRMLDHSESKKSEPAFAGWILASQSWLHSEVARATGDLEAAAMHASRMAALAKEVEHLPLACLGHQLSSEIYTQQGRTDLAVEERCHQLDIERLMQAHHLDGRDDIAALQVAARREGAQIAELSAKSMKLEKWANEDPLTGIANLRRFNQCLTEWSAASEDAGKPLCVALIDVDKFKLINDNFSHETGNEALRGIAAQMVAHVRPTDLAARWGGDEFAILFRDTDVATARQVAQRIQEAVRQHDWTPVAPGLSVSISVGVTEARASDSKTSIVVRCGTLMKAEKAAHRIADERRALSPLVLRTLVSWLRRAERVVIFVGGGAIGESGVPPQVTDFGTWNTEDRTSFAHVLGMRDAPGTFATFWQEWRQAKRGKKPSESHSALVELSHRLPQVLFVTERIDGALAKAGADNVIELYGNAFRHRCGACGRVNSNSEKGRCVPCGKPSAIRPDIVLLGEEVDGGLLAGAELAIKRADVILVVDCDATAFPGAGLLEKGRSRGARVVMLGSENRTRRNVDGLSIPASPPVVAKVLASALDEAPATADAGSELTPEGFKALCFLSRLGADDAGVTLEQAVGWMDWEIATRLGVVPWMFPLLTQSRMNPVAPTPSLQDYGMLAAEEQVRAGMRKAFLRMLSFYGFEWRDGAVERAEGWRNGFASWAVRASHHDLFISRILGALTLMGLRDEAMQFLKRLEPEVKQYRGVHASAPLRHWRLAVRGVTSPATARRSEQDERLTRQDH